MLNLDTNKVTAEGGLREREAKEMGMKANLLESFELPQVAMATGADTSKDPSTSAHMLNWMQCVRSREKNPCTYRSRLQSCYCGHHGKCSLSDRIARHF